MTEMMNEKMHHLILQLCLTSAQALAEGVDSKLTEDNIVEIVCKGSILYVLWEDGENSGGYAEVQMIDEELIDFSTSYYGAKISYK